MRTPYRVRSQQLGKFSLDWYDDGSVLLFDPYDDVVSIPAEHRQAVALALMGQPDEAMVERCGRINFDELSAVPWEYVDEETRMAFKEAARAVLLAAFGGGEQAE